MSFWKTGDGDLEFFKEQEGCNSTSIVHTFRISNSVYFEMRNNGQLTLKWNEGDKQCERLLTYTRGDIADIITWLIRTYKKLF